MKERWRKGERKVKERGGSPVHSKDSRGDFGWWLIHSPLSLYGRERDSWWSRSVAREVER